MTVSVFKSNLKLPVEGETFVRLYVFGYKLIAMT